MTSHWRMHLSYYRFGFHLTNCEILIKLFAFVLNFFDALAQNDLLLNRFYQSLISHLTNFLISQVYFFVRLFVYLLFIYVRLRSLKTIYALIRNIMDFHECTFKKRCKQTASYINIYKLSYF